MALVHINDYANAFSESKGNDITPPNTAEASTGSHLFVMFELFSSFNDPLWLRFLS